MSDSENIQVSFVRESAFETTPSSALQEVLLVSGRLKQDREAIRSNTKRTDGQMPGSKITRVSGSGSLAMEFSDTTHDELLRGAIRSDADWSTAVNISGTVYAAVASGNKYTRSSGDFTTENITVGQWIYVAGFTEAANNGWCQVTSIASGEIVVSGRTLTDEAAGDAVTMKGQQIRNGTTKASYTFQQQFTDLTNAYEKLLGCRIGSFGFNLSLGAIITTSFDFMGSTFTQETSKAGDGTVTAAPSKEVMAEVDSLDEVWVDNTAVSWDAMGFSFNGTVNNRPQQQAGQSALRGIGQGLLGINGQFEMYNDDNGVTFKANYHAGTKISLSWAFVDADGNRYHVTLPKVLLTDESGDNPAQNTEKTLQFSFDAEPGGSFGSSSAEKTIQICKVSA